MTGLSPTDLWLAVSVAVFVLAILAIVLLARREDRPAASTHAKLDEAATKLTAADAKLTAIEHRLGAAERKWSETDHDVRNIKAVVQNLPTKDSINAIAVQVAESRGKMDGVQATLQGLTKSCDRIEDWLTKVSAEAIVGMKAANAKNGDQV